MRKSRIENVLRCVEQMIIVSDLDALEECIFLGLIIETGNCGYSYKVNK